MTVWLKGYKLHGRVGMIMSLIFQMNKLPLDYRGVQNVMSIDDSLTSHPVYIPVSHPNEINEIFDLVSYAKV